MISIKLETNKAGDIATMEIDVADGYVDLTVMSGDNKQYDFTISSEEWNLINQFVFDQTKKQKP